MDKERKINKEKKYRKIYIIEIYVILYGTEIILKSMKMLKKNLKIIKYMNNV